MAAGEDAAPPDIHHPSFVLCLTRLDVRPCPTSSDSSDVAPPEPLQLALETSGLLVPAPRAQTAAPWLPLLRRGIRGERVLCMDYADADGNATRRRIWPFAMAFFDGHGAIAAWCELRQDFRHFRADRVLGLADGGERYPSRRHALIRRWREATGYAVAR